MVSNTDIPSVIQVVGLRYYKAAELHSKGRVRKGHKIRLVRKPNNIHDKYAIQVVKRGALFGHIPKEIARKLSPIIDRQNADVSGVIHSISGRGHGLKIAIEISLESIELFNAREAFVEEINQTRGVPGVYEIYCPATGKRYIGSSKDVGKRWSDHIRNLDSGTHHSKKLQWDWTQKGGASFKFNLLSIVEVGKSRLIEEQSIIDKHRAYETGYNAHPEAEATVSFRTAQAINHAPHRNTSIRFRRDPQHASDNSTESWLVRNWKLVLIAAIVIYLISGKT
jgi:hypothetical protein